MIYLNLLPFYSVYNTLMCNACLIICCAFAHCKRKVAKKSNFCNDAVLLPMQSLGHCESATHILGPIGCRILMNLQ